MAMNAVTFILGLFLCFTAVLGELPRLQLPLRSSGGGCPKCPRHGDTAPPPGDFAFYFLVRQWPYDFCSTKQCRFDPASYGFTLHGLWPNLDNNCKEDFPELCDTGEYSVFDERNIDTDVLVTMNGTWPSFTFDNECFWNHEWRCHGTCSGLSQGKYFRGVVTLHQNNNIANALSSEGITPSSQPVSTADFADALTKHFGFAPVLHCDSHTGSIKEVFQCVDQDLNLMDCADACKIGSCEAPQQSQCGDSLIYDTPDVTLGPGSSECKIAKCFKKSGTCKK